MFLSSRSPEECIRVTPCDPWQKEYVEFSCLYPALEPFYFKWEKECPNAFYDMSVFKIYSDKYRMTTPIYAVIVYLLCIYFGKQHMKNRKPYDWRTAMAMWNLFLSVYSLWTVVRVLPALIHYFSTKSIRENLCDSAETYYGRGATGFWVQIFILSKFVELFDTLFIIVHKKPLIFLHWYHHVTVLLFTYHAYVTKAPGGPIFVTMNAAVHFVMYGYYFLMAMKWKPKWFNPIFITLGQIMQMVVGVCTMITSTYYYRYDRSEDKTCFGSEENTLAGLLMYASYLFLFLQFFVRRYFKSAKSKATTNKKKE